MTTELDAAIAARVLEREVHKRVYRLDPAGWVEDCINWGAESLHGERPIEYQLESLDEMARHGRMALRGPHGIGKTAPAAWAALWFADTRDGEDWKVATTATAWRQLREFLWPEIHKWARCLRWDVLARDPWREGVELLDMAIRLDTGSAFAIASNKPAAMEGTHADHILFEYDEAKGIPVETWDASEGAFSGAGEDTGREAFALAYSTPGEPSGRFYSIQARRPGLQDWRTRHVTKDEAIAAGRMSAEWAENRRLQWGEHSAMYRRRVLGEFATDADSVIPLDWVEAAVERGRVRGRDEPGWWEHGNLEALGVDVSDGGSDDTVLAPLLPGWAVGPLTRYPEGDTMETAARCESAIRGRGGIACVDAIGIGAGVVARLRELDYTVLGFVASENAHGFTDRTGELGFANLRAAAWWNARELLDPVNGVGLLLPDDDMLVSDLTTPRWKEGSGNRIIVEPKDGNDPEWGIRRRLGRSTDAGDAVVQALFTTLLAAARQPKTTRTRSRLRA